MGSNGCLYSAEEDSHVAYHIALWSMPCMICGCARSRRRKPGNHAGSWVSKFVWLTEEPGRDSDRARQQPGSQAARPPRHEIAPSPPSKALSRTGPPGMLDYTVLDCNPQDCNLQSSRLPHCSLQDCRLPHTGL